MKVATTEGVLIVSGMTLDDRSTVGSHWNAIANHLHTGEIPRQYSGKDLEGMRNTRVSGYREGSDVWETFELETDPGRIEYQGSTGELTPDNIYDNRKAA